VRSGTTSIGTVILLADITDAKVAERSKDEFFSIASHELRTPLTAIKGNASMILDYYKDKLKDPSLREMVEDVHTSSVRLIEIVNDFLDTSRLEQGKIQFKFQSFALDKVIEQVSYEMGAVLKQKDLKLTVDKASLNLGELPLIFADPDRTKQVIYNLVGNAAKFTEKGGITIRAHKEGPNMRVLVTDTGRGIPLEGQRLLFRKFQQAGSSLLTRDTTRGTGLGLYISKLLVEGMGGKIGLEDSEPGRGTTFFFTLPLAAKGKQAQAPAKVPVMAKASTSVTPKAPVKSKRIMIFEDDPYVQRLYRRLFAFEQWSVEIVGDGGGALAKVKAYKPDLIMLDVMMPKTDGLAVLRDIRKSAETKSVPVVVLSNIGEADTIAEAKKLGVSGYLIKADFTPEQMLEEVKRYL
jgi:CheY-like chemotaxis protein